MIFVAFCPFGWALPPADLKVSHSDSHLLTGQRGSQLLSATPGCEKPLGEGKWSIGMQGHLHPCPSWLVGIQHRWVDETDP